MIFERIDGEVKAILNGKTLSIGDSIEDTQWPLVSVIGIGKVIFRVDPNCAVERAGMEATVSEQAPAPVVKPEPAPKPTPEPVPEAPKAE